ncbi:MAG: GAF domain-containing protein [Chlorobiaceae bacterium]
MPRDTITRHANAGTSSESALYTLVHAFPDVAFVISPQGIILDANQAFSTNFNKTPEEFFGLSVFDFLSPEVGTARKKMLQEAVQNFRPLTFDDEDHGKLIRSTIYPYRSKDGTVDRLLIIAQDITDIGHLLKKEQLFNKQTINAIPGTFYLLDAQGKFVAWNEQSRTINLGKSDAEMAETSGLDALHPDDQARVSEQMQDILNNGSEKVGEYRLMVQGTPAEQWRLMTGKRIIIDGSPFLIGVGIDITERKHAETELERKNRTLAMSDQCNHALLHAQDETVLLQQICNIITQTGGYRMAWVGYAEQDKEKRIRPVAQAGFEEGYLETLTVSWADDKFGQGPAGTAVRTRQPSTIHNIHENPQFDPWRTEATKRGYTSIHSIPLLSDQSVFGTLTIYSELPNPFHAAEKKQLMSMADNLAFGIRMLRGRIALKESEERFRNLFERNAAITIILDPDTGNIVDANKAAVAFYGWSLQEFKSMNIAQINSIASDSIKNNLEKVRSTGSYKFSFQHHKKDGSPCDVTVLSTKINDGRKDLINAIIYDVTLEKRYEQINAFRLSILQMAETHSIEELLTTTLDEAEKLTESSIGFVFFVAEDQNTLTLQTVSTNTLQNMCKAEGKGLHYPLEKAGVWADALREKKAVIHNDYPTLKHRKGTPEGHVEIKRELVIPISRDGKIVAIFGVGNKQTEYGDNDIAWLEVIANHVWDMVAKKIGDDIIKLQQQKHDELTTAKDKAEETDLQKSAFLTTITHELRTPMHGILGLSELLKDPALTNEESTEYIRLIHKSGQRLLTLINELIDIARIEAGETNMQQANTNINKLLTDLTAMFKIETHKKGLQMTCTTTLPDSESTITTDSAKLTQILTNLINNALKFTFQGGIAIGYTKNNSMLEFTVKDTGIGIPAAMHEKIFDRFIQVDNPLTSKIEGSGLGLSITKACVEMLGGTIHVESQEGTGSTFSFTLPYIPVLCCSAAEELCRH